jgi:glycosyltransferase involved in cell wall biosynthesis
MLNSDSSLKILVLEPYYGGSHKSFLDGLKQLPFKFTLLTFPARKWKWRMRLSAPYYAEELHKTGHRFDRILCSTFVDVSAFRGLAPAWAREVPLLTYFHENQFTYPVQTEDERDLHFALTNMTSALASDSLAFNSSYNLETFLSGIKELLRKSPDFKLDNPCDMIRSRSRILPPGIDFSAIDTEVGLERERAPVILWNHRWEHDKRPELFFNVLFELDREGLDFKLIVLGKSYTRRPRIFEEVKKRLRQRIIHYGYIRGRSDYAQWLRQGDIIISTAVHEFFGIAVVEAVRAGCRPLLPRRLSYPELFPEEFLYEEKDFVLRLKQEIQKKKRLLPHQARDLTDRFSWKSLAPNYIRWFKEAPPRNNSD